MSTTQTAAILNGAPPPILVREPDEFKIVRVDRIVKAEANPRKRFDEIKLNELAASVKQVGVLEPLLVQPYKAKVLQLDFDYRLIAGERRLRAARIAGLTEIPVIIKDLSDEEVLCIQVIENAQREDVHPIEEGEGFEALIRQYGYTPKQIAEKIGSDESFVHKRLKLTYLIDEAKEHFYAGRLTIAHYLHLARLDEKSQRLALNAAWEPDYSKQNLNDNTRPPNLDKPRSVREFAEHIRQHFFLSLKSAPWDKTDPKLYKKAGACNTCPKRTGANALLFDDTGAEDNCLDAACFAKKAELHLVQVEKASISQGVKLVRVATSYAKPEELEKLNCLPTHGAYMKVSKGDHCAHTQRAVVVHGDNIGRQFDICAAKKCKQHMAKPYGSPARNASPEAKKEAAARQLERDIAEETTSRLVAAILGKLPVSVGINEKLLIASELLNAGGIPEVADALGWKIGGKGSRNWQTEKIEFLKYFRKADEAEQTKALVATCLLAMTANFRGDDEPDKEFVSLTQPYGVDRKAIEAKVRAEFAPKEKEKAEPKKATKASAKPKAKTAKKSKAKAATSSTQESDYDYSDLPVEDEETYEFDSNEIGQ